MDNSVRPISPEAVHSADEEMDRSLRPRYLEHFIGQENTRTRLQIPMLAAKQRGEALDHVLIFGPPGLGKTTLAHILANELSVDLVQTSGPVLERQGDVAATLTRLKSGDVLFIDEIHRLNPVVEEVLYPAMEDYRIDIMMGQGPGARTIQIDLQPFTLVGATTRKGLLTSPLRERFGIEEHLDYYSTEELMQIVWRSARIFEIDADEQGVQEIAQRARGTPRVANRLLRRVRDYAQVRGDGRIDQESALRALELLEVDKMGLDSMDQRYLMILLSNYEGGPVGVETIAAAMSEERGTIEDTIEPFLLQQGYLKRTPRGRQCTAKAWAHMGMKPGESSSQGTLL